LRNTNLVFISAIVAGLAVPIVAAFLVRYIVLVLIVIMTLSLTQVNFSTINLKREFRGALPSFLANYIFLSGIIIVGSRILVKEPQLLAGFLIMAAVPSAVAVIPFTGILRGNLSLSLISSTLLYLLSPIIASIIIYIGGSLVGIKVEGLMEVLVELIVLPLFLSRLLLKLEAYPIIENYRDIIINMFFFILIYSVVGVNRHVFLKAYLLYTVSTVCFLRTFIAGTIVYVISKILRVKREEAVCYTLFGSFKNLGLTATMALTLMGEEASVPAVICIPFEILSFTYFSWLLGRYSVSELQEG
jgi:BASS family bile acid:Na+ symporter